MNHKKVSLPGVAIALLAVLPLHAVWAQPVAAPVHTVAIGGGRAIAGQVLVRLRPEFDTRATLTQLSAFGTPAPRGDSQPFYRINLKPGFTIPQAVSALKARPEVLYAEPNYLRSITVNDTLYTSNQQYGINKIKLNLAWSLWKPRRQAVVAIVDTGVKTDHPDLTNMIYRDRAGAIIGFDATTDTIMTGPNDGHGHGTLCSGIAAAQTNNTEGVASFGWNGVAAETDTYDIKIMPVRVLDSSGSGSDEDVAQGIEWAADHGAEVISMSLGDTATSDVLRDSVAYAWGKGCVIVAAAGNHGTTTLFYPAAYPNVISVGATDQNDIFASWSAYGSWVSVAAPGVLIYTSTKANWYDRASGTSMACPFVAGLATFLLAHNPTLTNAQVKQAIETTTDTLPSQTKTISHGRINAQAAILAAKSPPLTGVVTLDTWNRIDTTINQTGNLVRVFIFPANSNPTAESKALASANVMLDERGWFSLPSGVIADGTYRIGLKPVTAYGLAKLIPGNIALSATNPPANVSVTLPLGDANRDGSIDVLDLDALVNAFDSVPTDANWNAGADFNGDDSVDVLDLDLLIRNFDKTADFLP